MQTETAPPPAAKKAKKMKPIQSRVRTGDTSIHLMGTLPAPACELLEPSNFESESLFEFMMRAQPNITTPNVAWLADEGEYHVSSTITPDILPGTNNQMVNCELVLHNTIDPRQPHVPLTIQWAGGTHVKCAEKSSFGELLEAGSPSAKVMATRLAYRVQTAPPLRLDFQAQLVWLRSERRSLKGYFVKVCFLIFQISHAQAYGVQLQLVNVGPQNLEHVDHPLVAAGLEMLNDQATSESMLLVCPDEVTTPLEATMAAMAAAAGPVLAPVANADISVIDGLVYPAVPTILLGTSAMPVPPLPAQAIATAGAFQSWADKVAKFHHAQVGLEAAFQEASAYAAATWVAVPLIDPNAPLPPYRPAARPAWNDLDDAQLVPEDSPLFRTRNPLSQHPQHELGLTYYNVAARRPVPMTTVPLLPTMEIITILQLPQPGSVSVVQLILGLLSEEYAHQSFSTWVSFAEDQWQVLMITFSAIVSALMSTVCRSYNLTGIDIWALMTNPNDTTPSIHALAGSDTICSLGEAGRCMSGVFMQLRALIRKCTGLWISLDVFSHRVWNNINIVANQAQNAAAMRFVFGENVPNQGNALAINNILCERPVEWGLSAGSVKMGLAKECKIYYTAEQAGIWAYFGDETFKLVQDGARPAWFFIPHASSVVQTSLRLNADTLQALPQLPPVQESYWQITPQESSPVQAVRIAIAAPVGLGNTCYLVPNQVKTFRHRDGTTSAPVLLTVHLGQAQVNKLATLSEQLYPLGCPLARVRLMYPCTGPLHFAQQPSLAGKINKRILDKKAKTDQQKMEALKKSGSEDRKAKERTESSN